MDINITDSVDLEDLDILDTIRQSDRIRNRVNPFELSEEEFRYKYRLSKTFCAKIIDLLRAHLAHDDARGFPLSPELQVVCALRNWARHEIQDDTADLHGVSQPLVSRTCKKVADALSMLSRRFIKMPVTVLEQAEGKRKFRAIANFPNVIGAIDCTHIKVKKINADGGQLFINRKGYSSINVQVVCDADLKIMDIVTRWRGSVHDARIFRECRLKQRFEAGAFSGILIGDSGYPCTPYLFTPVLNPTTPAEEAYNRSHIRTRNTVERCFGLWKQRFRCLLRGMYGDIETVRKTIVACAVLHNLAIEMCENTYPYDTLNNSEPPEPAPRFIVSSQRGNILRRLFIETHFR